MAQGRPGRKREREFLTQLKHSFLERNAFFYKIPDMPHFEGAKFRFDIPKPFDGFGCFAGSEFVIEAKVISRFKKFSLKDLRPCQIEGLGAWERSGGKSFIFVLLWQQGRPSVAMTPIYRLYVLPWAEFQARGGYSKAEMVMLPFIARYRLKRGPNDFVYRFNVDEFLISLAMA